MPQPAPAPAGYVSIADAASVMGLTPWDVVRLIEARKIETIQFVSVESLGRLKGAA